MQRISLATNLDYHYESGSIIWADSDKGTITSILRDGTNRKVLVDQNDGNDGNSGLDWLGGLAVDWIAQNLYWTDLKRGLIEVMRVDGSFRYVVVSNAASPRAIAVDPQKGLMFYAGENKIVRMGLDGSQVFVAVNQTAIANSLALDVDNYVIYWSEGSTDTIFRADYDGTNKKAVFSHAGTNPIGLDIVNNQLFWAETTSSSAVIKMAPLANVAEYTILQEESTSIKDLKFFSLKKQNGTNLCAENNGGCQELCLFNGTHPICACSHGKVAADGKSCEDYDTFLIYSKVNVIESIHLHDHTNMNGPISRIQNSTLLKNTIALSFDYATSKIFYSDIQWGTINSVYFNGSEHKQIVTNQVTVEGLAFDPVSHTLFWTSNNDASIRTIDTALLLDDAANNTRLVKQIVNLKPHDKLRGIAVESCLGMVYWTNWNSLAPSIQRAYISGYGIESIITTEIRMPNAITLDTQAHKLFWADARLDKIEKTNLDGTNRVVLAHSTPKHPFALAIHGDNLYWTDWILHAVISCNKYSGGDVVLLRKDINRPMGIVAVQDLAHNCTANPCLVLNGGCEDVCLIDDNGKIACQCTQGVLEEDGKRCRMKTYYNCENGQFRCSNGGCIPFYLTCDSVAHCADGSDEALTYCSRRTCPRGYFQCNNHRCIPAAQTCNGVQECGDGSDEAICDCTDLHFRCNSGQCILSKHRCDFDPGKLIVYPF